MHWNGDYAFALLIVAVIVAAVVAVLAGFGFEKKDIRFGETGVEEPQSATQT
jgi:SHS family lactate transporter-like MFS transporter